MTDSRGVIVGEDRLVRLHVNLNRPTADALKASADRKGVTVTEAVRKAIGTWTWLDKQVEQGSRLQVVDPDGNIREVILQFAD
jgi:hypothetical protein